MKEQILKTLKNLSTQLIYLDKKRKYTFDKELEDLDFYLKTDDIANMLENILERIEHASSNNKQLSLALDKIYPKLEYIDIRLSRFIRGEKVEISVWTGIVSAINWIYITIEPSTRWEYWDNYNRVPNEIAERLRYLKKSIESITIDKEQISRTLGNIEESNKQLISLKKQFGFLAETRKEADSLLVTMHSNNHKSTEFRDEVAIIHEEMISFREEVQKIVSKCEDSYSILTTVGLSRSFQSKATWLTVSMYVWVAALIASLWIGGTISSTRLNSLISSLDKPDAEHNTNMTIVALNFALVLISCGATIWIAWLSTRQVGITFKLAEDYAFKASISKAYEGYRKEAVRIDPDLEAKLFASALSRFDESPIRLLNKEDAHSPIQELLNSKHGGKILEALPELKNDLKDVITSAISKGGKKE